ncbi:Uncharacterized protein TCM_024432 [Theobroma cacao]|uniref:Uncharacterized protein n=1 Tax=Theobroma cacao TaxID=3641 RepID=A0A061F3G8_THECC|nr:Uncharacterized protein TCM_024432 [Theobroma cacao]
MRWAQHIFEWEWNEKIVWLSFLSPYLWVPIFLSRFMGVFFLRLITSFCITNLCLQDSTSIASVGCVYMGEFPKRISYGLAKSIRTKPLSWFQPFIRCKEPPKKKKEGPTLN